MEREINRNLGRKLVPLTLVLPLLTGCSKMPPESIDCLVGGTVLGVLGLVVMYKDQENRLKDNRKRRLDKYAKENSKNSAERRLLRRFIEYNDLPDE